MSSNVVAPPLTESSQLDDEKSYFQLGSLAVPVKVVFGCGELYHDNYWRGITLESNTLHEQSLLDVIGLLRRTDNYTPNFVVKLSRYTKITDTDDNALTIDDINAGQRIVAIVKPYTWSYDGKTGKTLQCLAVKVIDTVPREEFKFS